MRAKRPQIPPGKLNLFYALLVTAFLLASLKLVLWVKPDLFVAQSVVDMEKAREDLRFSLYSVLFEYGIRVDWISGDNDSKHVRIPGDLAIHEPYAALVSKFRELGGTLKDASSTPSGNRMAIEVAYRGDPVFNVTLLADESIKRVGGEIAIIIDDLGNSFKGSVRKFLELEHEISISVLPGLRYSEEISNVASNKGVEVLLHLPMEPGKEDYPAEEWILTMDLSAEEIRKRTRNALKTVPSAVGVNNMGAKAAAHPELLKELMLELKKQDLFFLDSMANPVSQACKIARNLKVPTVTNNTFLDSIEEAPFVRKQVHLLGEIASRNGHAVGIGHANELTFRILKEEMPRLEKLGFRFVWVSQLTQ